MTSSRSHPECLAPRTLFQKTTDGKLMVDLAKENGIIPGIKVGQNGFDSDRADRDGCFHGGPGLNM